eukprot:13972110-Ditylum_brightwellii.AAC.1
MEEAEATLPEVPHHWWLDTLHHAYQERMNVIDPAVDIYQGDVKSKPNGQLRKAAKYLKQCRNDSKKLRDEYLQRIALEEATTNGNADVAKI